MGKITSTLAEMHNLGDVTGRNEGGLASSITGIINIIVGVLGIVAVIVIIMGGVGYMTSAGDPGKVKKAKDTILYGCIGLAICALAFVIVNFVISAIPK